MEQNLHRNRLLPEFRSVVKVASEQSIESWLEQHISRKVQVIERNDNVDLAHYLKGEGQPVCIKGIISQWPACHSWKDFDSLKAKIGGDTTVQVNDRAPARHADSDPQNGGKQQTLSVSLSSYLHYLLESCPSSLSQCQHEYGIINNAPFYLNGWAIFAERPDLLDLCPMPKALVNVDDTLKILQSIGTTLFKSNQQDGWCYAVDRKLTKLFIGPPGTVTRLHYDAGDAHGWLGQICGSKLFILYPPSDTEALQPLQSEKETVQSSLDPFDLGNSNLHNKENMKPLACILNAGDVIVIPKGWWHYAMALDRSITFQRNFYSAQTNAEGLVKMVLKSVGLVQKR